MGKCLSTNMVSDMSSRRSSKSSTGSADADISSGLCNADPITTEGKRAHMIQMMSVPLVPVIILSVQIIMSAADAISAQIAIDEAINDVSYLKYVANVIEVLENENRLVMAFFDPGASRLSLEVQSRLLKDFQATDEIIKSLPKWPNHVVYENTSFQSKDNFLDFIKRLRGSLFNIDATLYDHEERYEVAITAMLNGLSSEIELVKKEPVIWKKLVAYELSLRSKLFLSKELVMGNMFLFHLHLSPEDMLLFIESLTLGKSNLNSSLDNSQYATDTYNVIFENSELLEMTISKIRSWISNQRIEVGASRTLAMTTWYTAISTYLDSVLIMEKAILDEITDKSNEILNDARVQLYVAIIVMVIVGIVLPLIVYAIYRLMTVVQNFALTLTQQNLMLRKQKKKTDELLYLMLPKSVALQLRINRQVTAESYNSVTIFFSDICGFTAISARSTPMEVVALLNQMYYLFDTTIDRYDVYKVETIGDAYMVCSGCPQRNGSSHAGEIACLSMDLLEGIKRFKVPHLPKEKLRIRIGLHTGPVVAGVVGSKMPRYCLFGETVTLASKMESGGVPMKIHLSVTCKACLDTLGGYIMHKREDTPTASVGFMETYFLKGRSARPRSNRSSIATDGGSSTDTLTLPLGGKHNVAKN